MVSLSVAEVERLPTAPGLWSVRNETDPDPLLAKVLCFGSIQRIGYIGAPNAV